MYIAGFNLQFCNLQFVENFCVDAYEEYCLGDFFSHNIAICFWY